ncbi:MAG: flagellar filament capping protein FliD [Sphingomonas sp.]
MATSASSILTALGTGSGIDLTSLVTQLVDAQFASKNQQLGRQNQRLTAQISGAGQLRSNITSFADGLRTLATGGSTSTSPTSSNTSVVTATRVGSANLTGLNASIEVQKLARGQTATTAPVTNRTSPVGAGTLTLTFGAATVTNRALTGFVAGTGTPVDITIDPAKSSLDDIAKSINAANAGVTASILTDASGARLTLRSQTGANQAFTLTATEDPAAPGLSALNIGVGTPNVVVGSAAQDAVVAVDGVQVSRSTNLISDLVEGVRFELVSEAPGTTVAIGSSAPTSALRQAVTDFVSAFNNLQNGTKNLTSATGGDLFGDPAARNFQTALGRLTLTNLATPGTAGAPRTLADIGVATNRDGTLSVRADRLDAALSQFPNEVEALFADGAGSTGGGLAAAFKAIADTAVNVDTGLGGSITRYTRSQGLIAEQQSKASADRDVVRARLTQQFAGVDSQLAAYKSTQSQLTSFFAPRPTN